MPKKQHRDDSYKDGQFQLINWLLVFCLALNSINRNLSLKRFFLCFFFGCNGLLVLAMNPPINQTTAENVLINLYKATGDFTLSSLPKIEISNKKERVAAYYPRQNKIVLESTMLSVCSSFGEDSTSALAFIIGHELTHAYQKRQYQSGQATNYLGFHKSINAEIRVEKEADIHGLFNAWLAGYKAVEILPDLITKLYKAYDLMNVPQTGYPPLEERKSIAIEVRTEVKKMTQLYDAANYLTVIGRHDLAAANYEYIVNFYKGKEVYNNIGVNYVLDVLNFSAKDVDVLLYPLELDWNARIKKPKTTRGSEDLTPEERQYRQQQLQLATSYLAKAKQLDPHHFSTHINQLCILNLMGNYSEVINYVHQNQLANKTQNAREQALIELSLAIAYAKQETPTSLLVARKIWEELESHQNPAIAYQASYNLKMLSYEKCDAIKKYDCLNIPVTDDFIDNIRLHRTQFSKGFALNQQVSVELQEEAHSLVYIFKKGYETIVLQRMYQGSLAKVGQLPQFNTTENPLQVVFTDTGAFLTCEERKMAVRANEKGMILEWCKWWE